MTSRDLRFLTEHTAAGRIELVAIAEQTIPAGTALRLVHLGGAVAAVAHVIHTPAAPPAAALSAAAVDGSATSSTTTATARTNQ